MNGEYAVYLIGPEEAKVRYFLCPADGKKAGIGTFEQEVAKVAGQGFNDPRWRNYTGNKDPYEFVEEMLAEHYGYARMVETHYDWRPRVRY